MKTKFKTLTRSQNKFISENSNFLNNQNYVTLGKKYRLLNYYAFNIFSHRKKTKIIKTTKKNMQNYFKKKLKEYGIISLFFSIFYLGLFIDKYVLVLVFPLILFHIIISYSFIYFIFNKKNNNFNFYLDKNKYIIIKK